MSTVVPPGFDLTDPDILADHLPLDVYSHLRREDPVFWNAQDPAVSGHDDGGFWAITRHEDVKAVSTARTGWSVEQSSAFVRLLDSSEVARDTTKELLLCMDPPRHTRVRGVAKRCFTPRAVGKLEDDLRERAARIVWSAAKQETGDFVADVACHLPLQAIAGLMGFPDADREQLIHWSDQMAATEDPEYGTMNQTATFELLAYAYSSAEERKARDLGDVTSRLVRPDASGQTLSSEEYGFFFIILAVAGNETTRQAIAHGMLAFLENPDQWERWRTERPSTTVDEILRYASPAVVLQRTATEDTEIGDRTIRAGDRVGMYFASANFDDEVYEDPRRFDIGRYPNPHVTFGGGGPHFCIGANLTRLEVGIMFDAIADELSDVRLLGPPRRLRSSWLNGIKELPVSYHGSTTL
ncbi:MAG: cytochrome P450 [Acidimicrobiales bacterium]|jgi:cholest-4-en-3-one 26-monooxygenase